MPINAALAACLVMVALAAPAVAQGAAAPPDPAGAPDAPAPAAPAAPAMPATSAARSPGAATEAELIAAQKPCYPMNSCLACGAIWSASDTPLDIVRLGRLAVVCNADCAKAFDAEAPKLFKVLDDQVIAAQAASYPLTQCPVTGDTLGRKPKHVVLGTRLVEVCCGDCRKELYSDAAAAAAAFAQVDAGLLAAQSGHYARTTCVVDDKPLGDAPVQQLYGLTLVRFCSDGCQAQFQADPQAFRAQLATLRPAAPADKPKADAPPPAAGEGQRGR